MDAVVFDNDLFADPTIIQDPTIDDRGDLWMKHGGTLKTDSSIFKWVAVTLLVIAIIWILYGIFKQVRIAGEDRNQRLTRVHFNNIRGEDFDEEAKRVIEFGEAIDNPRAIDHYRVGAVYLLNARNPRAAHRHFNQALTQIINGNVNTREAPFILDRIDDFRDHFVDFVDVDELPLQRAMFAQFENQQRQIQQVQKEKPKIASDDPDFKQKTILSRQEWQSDSQNVHDTAIYGELNDQVKKVIDENSKIPDIQLHGYDEAITWLRVRYKNDPAKQTEIDKVISVLGNNYPVGNIPGVKEKDILTAVWQRTFDPDNKDRASQIRESMGDAVLDCVERDHVVCVSGRTSKIWQALARLDKDEEVGVLKTKQAIRNEIYQKAAKIVDDFVGENGSASQSLKESYAKNENSEQVKELIECMKQKIDDMREEYKPYMNTQQLGAVIEECKAVV